jgi:hypothetical protein
MDFDYQASQKLKDAMRESILDHYVNYSYGRIDKQTIPLYLFLSGAGTGKSRSGLEFHKTALQCFNGTWFPKTEDPKHIEKRLESALRDPYVFHVSFENGSCLRQEETDPWLAVGIRMLFQLLRMPEGTEEGANSTGPTQPRSLSEVRANWELPDPGMVLTSIKKAKSGSRATVIVADGLHKCPRRSR